MKKIAMDLVELIYNRLVKYVSSNDKSYISDLRDYLIDLRDIDDAIMTYPEQEFEKQFNVYKYMPETHNPLRMIILGPLSEFGEGTFIGATLKTPADRYTENENKHINTYIIQLHNEEEHRYIYGRTPEVTQHVQDFDLRQIAQSTTFKDYPITDTSRRMYDTLTGKKYTQDIVHLADFKSDLWTSNNHKHNVQFIIKLDIDGNPKVLITKADGDENKLLDCEEAEIFNLSEENKINLTKYKKLLAEIKSGMFDNLTWDMLIAEAENDERK